MFLIQSNNHFQTDKFMVSCLLVLIKKLSIALSDNNYKFIAFEYVCLLDKLILQIINRFLTGSLVHIFSVS